MDEDEDEEDRDAEGEYKDFEGEGDTGDEVGLANQTAGISLLQI